MSAPTQLRHNSQQRKASDRRLRKRVEQTGFPHDDKFRQLVTKAQEAMQELAMQTHYRAVDTLLRNEPKR